MREIYRASGLLRSPNEWLARQFGVDYRKWEVRGAPAHSPVYGCEYVWEISQSGKRIHMRKDGMLYILNHEEALVFHVDDEHVSSRRTRVKICGTSIVMPDELRQQAEGEWYYNEYNIEADAKETELEIRTHLLKASYACRCDPEGIDARTGQALMPPHQIIFFE